MKKTVIFLMVIFISNITKSQDISIGLIGGYNYYNYTFWGFPDSVKIDDYEKFAFPTGEHKFENKLNFSTGIKIEYCKNNIVLGSNMLYSAKDYVVNYDIEPTTISGQTFAAYDKSILRFRYFDFNINIGYTFLANKKINIIPQVGFTTGFLLQADSKVIFTDGREIIYKDYTDAYVQHQAEKILFAATGSISFRYSINNTIKLVLEPYFAQYINQLAKEPMDRNPMTYGAKIGIIYSFNKNKKTE
jgi:hypothetical protein